MVEGYLCWIFIDQGKRRARYICRFFYPNPCSQSFDQVGLPCSQIAGQSHYVSRLKMASDDLSDSNRFPGAIRLDDHG